MRRLLNRPRLVFALLLLIALAATLPMRLALGVLGVDRLGVSARAVEHSLWAGTLREVHFGDVDLGDSYAGVAPLPLLLGEARIAVASPGRSQLRGALGVTPAGLTLTATSATLNTGQLFAPLPISQLDLSELELRFVRGRCVAAAGRVKALLGASIAGIALDQGMSGTARCVAGALGLPLASQAGTERITLTIEGNGAYRGLIEVQTGDPATAQRLTDAGFVLVAGSYRLSITGRL